MEAKVGEDLAAGVGNGQREGLRGAVDFDRGAVQRLRRCLMTLAMDSPVRDWMAWEIASAVNTMVRCASTASRMLFNMALASRLVLDIRQEA